MKEILYYTNNKLNQHVFEEVQRWLKKAELPITCVSLNEQIDFGKNIVYEGESGYLSMFKQILVGLKASEADHIYMAEHDVLYHPSHFDFTPPKDDVYYYNSNAFKYKPKNNKIVIYDHRWLSQLVANRELLIQHYEKKIKIIEDGKPRKMYGYEPGTGHSRNVDSYGFDYFKSEYPNIDIRHGKNLSGTGRMKVEDFRDKRTCKNFREVSLKEIPGWSYQYLSQLGTKSS